MPDLVLCAATEMEAGLLRRGLGGARGRIGSRDVALVVTGVGPVNAACAVTRFLTREPTPAVIACGVGGAYPGSGLGLLDVVCAGTEVYGDLGAESAEGFLDLEALGFPLLPGHSGPLRLSLRPASRVVSFVTKSTCTGTEEAAREVAARTGGAVESMEGAAFVHAALLSGAEAGEVRAISNFVGARDRVSWKVEQAAEKAQEALIAWLEST